MPSQCVKHDHGSLVAEALHFYTHAKDAIFDLGDRRSVTAQEWASLTTAAATLAMCEQMVVQNCALELDGPGDQHQLSEVLSLTLQLFVLRNQEGL